VLGMTEPTARQLLLALQMQVEVRSATLPASIPGTITMESPAAGSEVARGSVVVLYVEAAKHGS
jgi:beta-lactam-binding protein with PASTA domain